MRKSAIFVFLVLSVGFAPVAFSQTVVDFSTPGDLANRFATYGTAGSFSQVTSGGITGGAVDVLLNNASDTAIFRTASPGGVGSTLQASVFFRYDATLRDPFNSRAPLTLGFSTSTSVNSTFPFSFIGGVDVSVYLQTFNSGNPLIFPVLFSGDSQSSSVVPSDQTVLGGDTLISGDWYRLTLGLQIVGGSFNQVTLSTALDDFGPTGQSPVPVNLPGFSGTASFNNAAGLPGVSSRISLFFFHSAVGTECRPWMSKILERTRGGWFLWLLLTEG